MDQAISGLFSSFFCLISSSPYSFFIDERISLFLSFFMNFASAVNIPDLAQDDFEKTLKFERHTEIQIHHVPVRSCNGAATNPKTSFVNRDGLDPDSVTSDDVYET
jgi:hypothetical protein